MYSKDETAKVSLMKSMMKLKNNNDEIKNQFKLMIYDWDLEKAMKYYKRDLFCHYYCLSTCRREESKCSFEHLFELSDIITIQEDENMGKILCLYLMYITLTNASMGSDVIAQIYSTYARLLDHFNNDRSIGIDLKCQKYFLKSLVMDEDNDGCHYDYAFFLQETLNDWNKALYHYQRAVELDPDDVLYLQDYGRLLCIHGSKKDHDYEKSLGYLSKACRIDPNNTAVHCTKAQVLYKLEKYDSAIDELMITFDLDEKYGGLNDTDSDCDKEWLISIVKAAVTEYIEKTFKRDSYFDQSFEMVKWLHENDLLSIKYKIFDNQISLMTFYQSTNAQLARLVEKLNVKHSEEVKLENAIAKLRRTTQLKDSDYDNDNDYAEQKEAELKQNQVTHDPFSGILKKQNDILRRKVEQLEQV